MPDEILCIEGLGLDYETKTGKQVVLEQIDLVQKRGEWLALIGPNGAGKTSLGLIIKGILKPTRGKISMSSKTWKGDLTERKRRIGFLFSNPREQICALTVKDDIAFGLIHQGMGKKEVWRRVNEAMDAMGIGHLAHHPAHSISGGEQQRMAMAGVIAMMPEYLILDEPASFLSFKERDELLQLVKGFHKTGVSILYISASWEEVVKADRVAVLNQGRISCMSQPDDLLLGGDILEGAGICLPEIYFLSKRLRDYGLMFPEMIQDVDRMACAIADKFKGKHDQ
ncbi:ATP-binding cassette domain-containing protein [bacterium]|nr:ATP-binding cassette domain-containing protein [bacterium]